MDALLKQMAPDSREAAKNYISQKQIPQLFESITAGMLHHRPENPLQFVQECLDKVAKDNGAPRWDSFINFNPSDKCKDALLQSEAKSSRESSRPSSKHSNVTSNNASYTPAPISAHRSSKPSTVVN